MITLYSGTPGSGKSYHTAYKIYMGLRHGRNFICNFPVNIYNVGMGQTEYWVKKIIPSYSGRHRKLGNFVYRKNSEMTVEFLVEYAKKNHSLKKEGETVIVIDEAGMIYNPRSWNNEERMKWIEFFSLHRHYGYDVILVSQSDRMIDRQIRAFVEYDIRHRKLNNYKLLGAILGLLSGGCVFGLVEYWYGVKEKIGFQTLRYNKKIASIYDTFLLFGDEQEEKEHAEADALPGMGNVAEPLGDPVKDSVTDSA